MGIVASRFHGDFCVVKEDKNFQAAKESQDSPFATTGVGRLWSKISEAVIILSRTLVDRCLPDRAGNRRGRYGPGGHTDR